MHYPLFYFIHGSVCDHHKRARGKFLFFDIFQKYKSQQNFCFQTLIKVHEKTVVYFWSPKSIYNSLCSK